MAMAGMPPRAMPSSIRRPSRTGKDVASGTSSPKAVARQIPQVMAFTLPIRSARNDQGMTVTARPTVASEMVSAASAALTRSSAAMTGSTACVE
jgi:hypothetical protein